MSRVTLRVVSLLFVMAAAPLVSALRHDDAADTVDWPITEFAEPSGIVYHPQRESLFVVGDEGDIGEVSLEGKLLRQFHFGGDLEAVTVDPRSGLLYVVRESHEIIFEVRPDNFRILRRFTIDRSYQGDPNYLRRGGDGIEGLTFVVDEADAEGGRLWGVNQFDPPVLVEFDIALRSSKEKFQVAKISRAIPVDNAPLSALAWDAENHQFLVTSALWRRVVVIDIAGHVTNSVRIPAFMPEGLARLPTGEIVIAQDSGGIVVWKSAVDPFRQDTLFGPPAPTRHEESAAEHRPGDAGAAPIRRTDLPAAEGRGH